MNPLFRLSGEQKLRKCWQVNINFNDDLLLTNHYSGSLKPVGTLWLGAVRLFLVSIDLEPYCGDHWYKNITCTSSTVRFRGFAFTRTVDLEGCSLHLFVRTVLYGSHNKLYGEIIAAVVENCCTPSVLAFFLCLCRHWWGGTLELEFEGCNISEIY